jgi:hypothetical protein
MKITYRELLKELSKMTVEQLDCDVSVCGPDGEFYEAELDFQDEDDVLDKDHPYLNVILQN